MKIEIIKKNQQARGQFNGGEILENKPIGFPREGGHLKPYSSLFYWAHAWSDKGSTIGLHPHQGFEIMSFVIEGSIAHFDTAGNEWKTLNKGAAQIIRAGNGISHSEKINAGAHMFQIWFDPNLEMTLSKPASYDDYPHEVFPIEQHEGYTKKVFKGNASPLQMDTEGIEINQLDFETGKFNLPLDSNKVYSLYLISGKLKVQDNELEQDDYFIVKDSDELVFVANENSTLFLIASPSKLDYKTYAEQMVG
tara:strand:- start:1629 stop:2381 length:753 start_codon:yes stop_codon:yes gene_type:complete